MNDHDSAATRAKDEEPQTPMWLPALGVALFVALGVAWAAFAPGPNNAAGDRAPTAPMGSPPAAGVGPGAVRPGAPTPP